MNLIQDIKQPFESAPQIDKSFLESQQSETDQAMMQGALENSGVEDQEYLERQRELIEIRKWQQDLQPKFLTAFEELSGYRFTGEGGPTKIPMIEPILDIAGAYHFINYLKILDHNVMRSNYNDTRINLTLRHGVGYPLISLVKHLVRSGHMQKNKAMMDYLVNYGFNMTEPTFYHALNDGERKHESQIHKYVETKNVGQEKEQKKFWSNK